MLCILHASSSTCWIEDMDRRETSKSFKRTRISLILSRGYIEISEKVQKSLITPIMNRLHRLECIETKEKSVESVFEICVIRERKLVFQSSHISNSSAQPNLIS
jgi:hypothetical protein